MSDGKYERTLGERGPHWLRVATPIVQIREVKPVSTQHTRTIIRVLGPRAARPLLTAALCAALVAATPATANAERVSDPDTVGDLVADSPQGRTLDPERTLNDIGNIKLTHSHRRVAIEVEYANLRRTAGGRSQYVAVYVSTNEGVVRRVEVEARPRHWSGSADIYGGRWRNVDCAMWHSIDYQANVIRVGFPRQCAGNPRWVQLRVLEEAWNRPDNATIWEDDGFLDSPKSRGRRLERSERVHVDSRPRVERGVDDSQGRLVQPFEGCPRTSGE